MAPAVAARPDVVLLRKAVLTGSRRPESERFMWANTCLGTSNNTINGTCRSCDPRHNER
jgi:hypothetical protein